MYSIVGLFKGGCSVSTQLMEERVLEKVSASAGTCRVALWRSLDLFMELSLPECDRRESFDQLGLSESLINSGKPLRCSQ